MPDSPSPLTALPAAPRAAIARAATHPLAPAGLLLLALGLVGALTVATHEVYEGVTDGDGIAVLDHPVLQFMIDHRTHSLTLLAQALAHAGDVMGAAIVTLLLMAGLCALRRDPAPALVIAPAMTGALAITALGKAIVGRVRPPHTLALPPHETSPSFPSGHTLNATVLMAMVAYLAWISLRRAWLRWSVVAACAGYALAMGTSRVYLGAHWLTDVIAGWLIGLAWSLAVITAHQLWLRRRRAERSAEPSRSC